MPISPRQANAIVSILIRDLTSRQVEFEEAYKSFASAIGDMTDEQRELAEINLTEYSDSLKEIHATLLRADGNIQGEKYKEFEVEIAAARKDLKKVHEKLINFRINIDVANSHGDESIFSANLAQPSSENIEPSKANTSHDIEREDKEQAPTIVAAAGGAPGIITSLKNAITAMVRSLRGNPPVPVSPAEIASPNAVELRDAGAVDLADSAPNKQQGNGFNPRVFPSADQDEMAANIKLRARDSIGDAQSMNRRSSLSDDDSADTLTPLEREEQKRIENGNEDKLEIIKPISTQRVASQSSSASIIARGLSIDFHPIEQSRPANVSLPEGSALSEPLIITIEARADHVPLEHNTERQEDKQISAMGLDSPWHPEYHGKEKNPVAINAESLKLLPSWDGFLRAMAASSHEENAKLLTTLHDTIADNVANGLNDDSSALIQLTQQAAAVLEEHLVRCSNDSTSIPILSVDKNNKTKLEYVTAKELNQHGKINVQQDEKAQAEMVLKDGKPITQIKTDDSLISDVNDENRMILFKTVANAIRAELAGMRGKSISGFQIDVSNGEGMSFASIAYAIMCDSGLPPPVVSINGVPQSEEKIIGSQHYQDFADWLNTPIAKDIKQEVGSITPNLEDQINNLWNSVLDKEQPSLRR